MVTKGFTASPLLQARLPCHDQKQVSLRAVVMQEAFLMVDSEEWNLWLAINCFHALVSYYDTSL